MEREEKRKEEKARHERYRVAAAKFGTVREHVTVNEDADRTGAYVEVLVWIPKEALTDVS